MSENLVDLLFLSETKLDESYKSSQFCLKGFSKPLRSDRNRNGGGLMLIVRSDIACRRLNEVELLVPKPIESLIVEVMIKKEMWIYVCLCFSECICVCVCL